MYLAYKAGTCWLGLGQKERQSFTEPAPRCRWDRSCTGRHNNCNFLFSYKAMNVPADIDDDDPIYIDGRT
jgi:hypothetical protein